VFFKRFDTGEQKPSPQTCCCSFAIANLSDRAYLRKGAARL
jgi:hypothetical protein